jgi:hypothetical protein
MKRREDWVLKYAPKCKWYFPWTQSFFSCVLFSLHLTSRHHILVLKLVLGGEMVDKKFWKCTLCNFNWHFWGGRHYWTTCERCNTCFG